MRSLAVGVIGHVDHGKTSLVEALTGTRTDRLKEERERGLSIVPGFAVLRRAEVEIDLVDLPGHERFVRAMISGATGVGAVLLVVAATEGVKPQTLEHLEIARVIGVRHGIVALTKCDLVTAEQAACRAAELDAIAATFGLAAPPPILTALPEGRGIPMLAAALEALAARPGGSARDDGWPVLPIDRVFPVAGFGPVVTGTLRRGALAVGDAVEIRPGGAKARVRSLQIHGRAVETAPPGRRVAVALRGVEIAELRRGQSLSGPGALGDSAWLDVHVTVVPSAPRGLRDGERLRLLVCTAETEARLRLLDRRELRTGESACAQLACATPVAVPSREPFVLRLDSPGMTLAGGRVLDPAARRRRRAAEPPASLSALAAGEPGRALMAWLAEAGPAGERIGRLARLVGSAPDRVARHLAKAGAEPQGTERVAHPEVWASLLARIEEAVGRYHRERPLEPGLPRDQAAAAVPDAHPALIDAAIDALARAGRIVAERGMCRLTDFTPGGGATSALADSLAAVLRAGGLAPPDEATLIGTDPDRRDALHFLARIGVAVRAVDRVQARAIFFHRDAIAAAQTELTRRFPPGTPFLAGEAGAALGISRKFSIPLLEHFDSVRFTRRLGDRRVVLDGLQPREGG